MKRTVLVFAVAALVCSMVQVCRADDVLFNKTSDNIARLRTSDGSGLNTVANIYGEDATIASQCVSGHFTAGATQSQFMFYNYTDNYLRFRTLGGSSGGVGGAGYYNTVLNVMDPDLSHMSVVAGHFVSSIPGDQLLFYNASDGVMRLRKVNDSGTGLDTIANIFGLSGLSGCKAVAGNFSGSGVDQLLFYNASDNYLRFWQYGGATGGVGNGGYFNTVLNVYDADLAHANIAVGNIYTATATDELVINKVGDTVVRIRNIANDLSGLATVTNVFGEDATSASKMVIGDIAAGIVGDEIAFYDYTDSYFRVRTLGGLNGGVGNGGYFNTVFNVNDAVIAHSDAILYNNVPEPATMIVLVAGALGLLRRRK